MTKIGNSFRNFRDRIRSSVSVKTQNFLFFFALAMVIFLAIMIRMTPVLRGPELIKAFDPWIQYYNAQYLSEHSLYEYFNWHDYKSWYPEGKDRAILRPGLTFTVVAIYQALNFIGIPISLYEVCFYFPAFMGGATVFAMYLLGKEVLDKRAGLFAAFFLAFNTGHAQRTMAGFFDNETIGVFAALMTFVFFIKAIKTGKFSHAIIGGLFLGYLSLSWGGYSYLFFLLPMIVGLLVLLNKYDEKVLIAYVGTMGTGFLIYNLMYRFNPAELTSSLEIGGIFSFTIILTIYHLIWTKKREYPKFYNGLLSTIKIALIPISIFLAIVIWVEPNLIPFGIGGRLVSVLSPLIRDQFNLTASVAEHMPSAWSIFYYNTLIPLLLLPLGIYFCVKRGEAADILMLIFLLTLFYFTGSMIRIILLFAPAACLVGAYGLVNVLKIFGSFAGKQQVASSRKRRRQLKRTVGNSEVFAVYALVGFLCIAQVYHATNISITQLSYSQIVAGGQFHDWEESLTWMKNNLQGTDVVVSWWDYGYWLTPIGNVTTVNDNGTGDQNKIGITGMALMQTNEIYSAKIFRELEADYVLVYFGFLINGLGGDEGKWPWMVRIANDNTESYRSRGFEEDNWKEDTVFDEAEYINNTSGLYEDKWFDSQLVRLMFYGEPTDPAQISDPNSNYLRWYYASHIAGNPSANIQQRMDDNGNTWKSHIPDNGQYDFKVFKPVYFSKNGMVKLFKLDYTALESSFEIKNAKVYDEGYATFYVENTGTRDLTFTDVEINNEAYNYTLGVATSQNIIKAGETNVIWVDIEDPSKFDLNDVVNITAHAEAEALEGTTYSFTNNTKNFFVSEAPEESIRINYDNTKVIYNGINDYSAQIEVENTGNSILKIDKFYSGESFEFLENVTTYTTSSSVLAPGEKSVAYIEEFNVPFDADAFGVLSNQIGVETANGNKDEVLISPNYEDYRLSIDTERIVSPELDALTNNAYRTNTPISLNNNVLYSYENGTNNLKVSIKNNGDTVFGLDSLYVNKIPELDSIYYSDPDTTSIDFDTINNDLVLSPGEENVIIADASEIDIDENDHVLITVTGSNYDAKTSASDVAAIYAISDAPAIQMIEKVENVTSSYILANETGRLTIKNTGNAPLTLQDIYINDTITLDIDNDVNFLYGDKDLGIQEVAMVDFDIPNIKINQSSDIKVNATTNSTASYVNLFEAIVNLPGTAYYSINIDPSSKADVSDDLLTLDITNAGSFNATIDTISINGTYVPLENFTNNGFWELGYSGHEFDQIQLTISIIDIIDLTPLTAVNAGDKLKILVRTVEGAEREREITVIA